MEFYLDEKQKNKKRKVLRLKIYGVIAVFLFLFVGFFYFAADSRFFKIKSISAVSDDGNEYGAESEKLIKNLKFFFIGRSKIAGLLGFDNILIWNADVADFLKSQPVFSALEINKDYFKKEIFIKFKKREKFGIWCLNTQISADNTQINTDNPQKSASNPHTSAFECWWFDKDGIIFEKSPQTEGEMIYKINDYSGRQLNLTDKAINDELFKNLLKIFDVLKKADLNVKTLYIEDLALEETEVRPPADSIPKIYFSLRFDPSFALPAIESLKKTGLEKIQYIDFRVENRVYYKLK